jgi:hypothetical protein
MFLQGAAGDEMVVQVCEDEGEVAKQLVHEALEELSSICQTERHKQIFKQPEGGDDGGLLNVLGRHGDLMVPLHEIYT